jgi:NADP-dependent 3-hydroxy acid dehydrogenase YdfG
VSRCSPPSRSASVRGWATAHRAVTSASFASDSASSEPGRPERLVGIEPGAVATELATHITHDETKAAAEQLYSQVPVTAGDIAEVIVFAVQRPRHLAMNEILLRPAAQAA